MRIIILILINLVILGCTYSKINSQNLECTVDIDSLKKEILDHFDADSVLIYTMQLREEAYFPELRSPVILIYNATTKILDFKSLPIDYYQWLANPDEIQDSLTKEAEPLAKILSENCDLSKFNDLIIEFRRQNKLDDYGYRFICHYSVFLEQDSIR